MLSATLTLNFHLENYHYCYAGLYTLGPSDISLAFDINRKDSQDLAFLY